MFTILDGRKHFFQWDLNRKIIVADETVTEVHFCNRTDDCALVCKVYLDAQQAVRVADVPNILLQDNWRISVYAYDGEATKHSALFDVKPRSKPDDYVYTETEVKRWEDLAQKIEDATTPEAIKEALGESAITTEDIITELDLEGAYADSDVYNANAVNAVMMEVASVVNEVYETTETLEEEVKRIEQEGKQNYANAVHGSASGEIVYADDISSLDTQLEINIHNAYNHATTVIGTSKNLATIVGRKRNESFGTAQNTSTRPFYGNNLVLNISGSNYYTGYGKLYNINEWITYDRETETFTLPYNEGRNNWYGVGIDVRVKPKTTYYLCGETLTDNSVLIFAQYDKDGNYLTFASLTGATGKITTTADAAWGLLVFASKTKATEAKFRNVIFKESATVPEFEPATEVTTTSINSFDGVIPRVAEDMCIYSKDFDTTVEVNYTKDLNAVIDTLTRAIISLGGNI